MGRNEYMDNAMEDWEIDGQLQEKRISGFGYDSFCTSVMKVRLTIIEWSLYKLKIVIIEKFCF